MPILVTKRSYSLLSPEKKQYLEGRANTQGFYYVIDGKSIFEHDHPLKPSAFAIDMLTIEDVKIIIVKKVKILQQDQLQILYLVKPSFTIVIMIKWKKINSNYF